MFVTKRKYNRLKDECEDAIKRLHRAVKLIKTFDKDMIAFAEENRRLELRLERLTSSPSQLSKKEIDRLIHLCHPDKHGGKTAATEMTSKLLEMRRGL